MSFSFYLFSSARTIKERLISQASCLFWVFLFSCILLELFQVCGRHGNLGLGSALWALLSPHNSISHATNYCKKNNYLEEVLCLGFIPTNFQHSKLNRELNIYRKSAHSLWGLFFTKFNPNQYYGFHMLPSSWVLCSSYTVFLKKNSVSHISAKHSNTSLFLCIDAFRCFFG